MGVETNKDHWLSPSIIFMISPRYPMIFPCLLFKSIEDVPVYPHKSNLINRHPHYILMIYPSIFPWYPHYIPSHHLAIRNVWWVYMYWRISVAWSLWKNFTYLHYNHDHPMIMKRIILIPMTYIYISYYIPNPVIGKSQGNPMITFKNDHSCWDDTCEKCGHVLNPPCFAYEKWLT